MFFPSFPHYAVFTALIDGRPLLSLAVFHCSRSLGIRFLEDKLWHAFHSVWYVFSRVSVIQTLSCFHFLFSMVKEGWYLMVNSISIDIMFLLFYSFMFCLLLAFHERTNASNSFCSGLLLKSIPFSCKPVFTVNYLSVKSIPLS